MATNFRNKSASQHSFAMIPRADIPRSKYMLQQTRKQTFDAGDLVPVYCEEILPGDHFNGESTIYARLATPITPVLDNAELETFFFAVPLRILWEHWEDFIAGGNYTIPETTIGAAVVSTGSIWDQFGIPVQFAANININVLPLRAYNMIYNEWFRDQNLTTAVAQNIDDGVDPSADYTILKRAKKHDYFTSCLPWPQKGTAVSLPLGTSATVYPAAANLVSGVQSPMRVLQTDGGTPAQLNVLLTGADGSGNSDIVNHGLVAGATATEPVYPSNLYADLSTATSATINAIRVAFQVQRLLERDARGGTRYTELVQAHFGVRPPDYRLQRPEYIGGGRTQINTHPIAQTSSTDATTPQGNLAAFSTANGGGHRFNYAATEHCYIIGLANVRCDLTYQQGLRKHWTRSTRYDYYFPAFAHLGEQAVSSQEIYCTGAAGDADIFGYQERWAEYRYTPNEITGLFRSTAASSIDIWHYSEEFGSRPTLNNTFITDPSETTLARSLAVGEEAAGQQILLDILHRVTATRPMPTYSVPGLIDHF